MTKDKGRGASRERERHSDDPVLVKPGGHIVVDHHAQPRFVCDHKIPQTPQVTTANGRGIVTHTDPCHARTHVELGQQEVFIGSFHALQLQTLGFILQGISE